MSDDDDFGLSPFGKALVESAYPELKAGDLPDIPPDPNNLPFRPYPFEKYRKFTLESDLASIITGKMQVPNFKPIPHWRALAASMGYGRTVEMFKEPGKSYEVRCRAKIGDDDGQAIFHLNCGQSGGFTGEGVVVMRAGYRNDETSIVTGTFALCEHKKVEGPGADHSRGWHPGWCEKCGLDMSVDSGD